MWINIIGWCHENHIDFYKYDIEEVEVCVCVYLAGKFSGWRDDHSSKSKVSWLLQVGKQWETERQSLP